MTETSLIEVSAGFVGRHRELEKFAEVLNRLETGAVPSSRFLHLYGPAGIGKTTLLKEWGRLCRFRRVAYAYISFEKEVMKDEEQDFDEKDMYSEAVLMIAEQLARAGTESMNQLRVERDDVLLQVISSNPEERQSANKALGLFSDKVVEELVSLAHQRPVVLFIDGLEDPTETVREQLESPLLIRFAEAPFAVVVSASRASLPATWSSALRDRFTKIHVLPLSAQEVDQLLEVDLNRQGPDAQLVRTDSSMVKYIREIGQGHPEVSGQVFDFLVQLIAARREAQNRAKEEKSIVRKLNHSEIGDLLEYVHRQYVEPFALRDLHLDPWGERVYRTIVPARYFDLDSLGSLLKACNVPRASVDWTEQRATRWLEQRGLVRRHLAGVYELDSMPRDLLVRRMAHFEKDRLIATTKTLVDLYRTQAMSGGDAANLPLAIREYLYQLHSFKQLNRPGSQLRLEQDIVDELNLCLSRNHSRPIIDALLGYLEDDDELRRVFSQSLMSEVIASTRRLMEPDTNILASELVREKESLIGNVINGGCVLFLGPGLTLGPNYMDVYEKLAQRLIDDSGCVETAVGLDDAAQCYVDHSERRGGLEGEELTERYVEYIDRLLQPDQVSLDTIVSLPFRTIVTTATDTSLETAYVRARWPVEVILSPLDLPKIERGEKLLVKLFGSTDRRSDLVLTRQEHLRLRADLAGADNLLNSHLRVGVPLFIGFSSRDPMLYFLHVLVHEAPSLTGRKSFIVLDESSSFVGEAWRNEIVTLDQSGKDFLRELQERWQNWQSQEMHIWSEAEVLTALRSGHSVAGKLMSRITFEEGTDLTGQNFCNCTISSGLLNGVLLDDALLEGVDLSNAALQDAQLRNCRASGANLTYANANRAKMGRVQFQNTVLTSASLHDVEITAAVFDGTDLIYAEMEGARGERPSFLNANLLGIDLSNAQLPGAVFRDSLIWGGQFRKAKLPQSDFSMANLVEAKFQHADLRGADFYFANLEGADFSGADVRGANFSQALLAGADLHDAINVLEARFMNAAWQEANLPLELRQQLEQAEVNRLHARPSTGRLVELAHEALSGNCILFVGPGLTLGPHYLDAYDTIKERLARECGLANNVEGLQDVAQYYAATINPDELTRRVAQEVRSILQPDEASLDLVVSLPFDVIVTTAVDASLEKAYARAGRRYEYSVSPKEFPVLEMGEDLILRLYGNIDLTDSSIVLTRRDRYELQTKLAQTDSVLSRYIGRRAPLFIGFSLRDPMLYFLHTLTSRPSAPVAGKSFVALDEPHPFFGEAWQREGLTVLDRSSHDLLEELHREWVERKSEERRIWHTAEVMEALHDGRSLAGKRMSRITIEEGTDLQQQDLRNSILASASLNGVLLNDALLQGADLSRAELEDAQLSRCKLLGANMIYVKLNRAKLDAADLGKAVLVQSALRDADLTQARLTEADLIFADLQGVHGEDVDFARARLSSALLSGANLPRAIFRSSFSERAEFRYAELSGADFQMSNLAEARFEGAILANANFHSSNLTGADFSGADIGGADFSQARLDGADFQEAKNVHAAKFDTSAWREALLPVELRQQLEQAEADGSQHRQ